mmetsp:Transcript_7453/g.16329  ORF Transcript_7453/g.16329 Transcript_7453/m.16329 type:complete len:423 (-) Transcript_7453:148-1416(-)
MATAQSSTQLLDMDTLSLVVPAQSVGQGRSQLTREDGTSPSGVTGRLSAAELAATSAAPSYVPAPWSWSGHVSSFFGFVKLPVRLFGGQRERLHTADGGTVVLHWWAAQTPENAAHPVVLLVHGINNSSTTPYLQYMARHLEENGLRAVVVNMRGHGGNVILSNRLYTARADDDLRLACEHIHRTVSPPFLFAIGFSMGANQLLAFLGSDPEASRKLVDAAISISCPFDLSQLRFHFQHGSAKVYGFLIAQALKPMLLHGRRALQLSARQVLRGLLASSVEEFDAVVQVPLLGLKDVEEYYASSSCVHQLPKITTPLLVVHAWDDPLIPPHILPRRQLESMPNVSLVTTEQGGHIGWHIGPTPFTRSWTERLCTKYILQFLFKHGGMPPEHKDGKAVAAESLAKKSVGADGAGAIALLRSKL